MILSLFLKCRKILQLTKMHEKSGSCTFTIRSKDIASASGWGTTKFWCHVARSAVLKAISSTSKIYLNYYFISYAKLKYNKICMSFLKLYNYRKLTSSFQILLLLEVFQRSYNLRNSNYHLHSHLTLQLGVE